MSSLADSFVQGFLLENLDIRGSIVRLSTSWQAMIHERHYPGVVINTLGETAAITALISANLKQPSRLTVQVQGNGPLQILVMDCDARLRLRGMAKAATDIQAAPIGQLLGNGQIVLSLQTEAAKRPYQSIVTLEGDTLSALFEHYLLQSEQQPTGLWLYADQHMACGLFLQALPGAHDKDPDGWNRAHKLASTIRPHELTNTPIAQLLLQLFPEDEIRLFDTREVTYECPRDEEKVKVMLRSLGRGEVDAMLAEQGGTLVVHDDMCNHHYHFDQAAIEALFDEPRTQMH